MRLAFTPGAGCSSKRVITGPGARPRLPPRCQNPEASTRPDATSLRGRRGRWCGGSSAARPATPGAVSRTLLWADRKAAPVALFARARWAPPAPPAARCAAAPLLLVFVRHLLSCASRWRLARRAWRYSERSGAHLATRPTSQRVQYPVVSIMDSQERPVNSEKPDRNSASNSKVAPRLLRMDWRLLPMTAPSTPPASRGRLMPVW